MVTNFLNQVYIVALVNLLSGQWSIHDNAFTTMDKANDFVQQKTGEGYLGVIYPVAIDYK